MATHGRPRASSYMKRLNGEAMVKRFPQAFVEDPNLTPEIFYDILCSVKFDVKEAQLKVIERVRKPGEFILPAELLDNNAPSLSRSFSASQQGGHGSRAARVVSPSVALSLESPLSSQIVESEVLPSRLKRPAPLDDSDDDIRGSTLREKRNKSQLPRPYPSLNTVEPSGSKLKSTSKNGRICGFLQDTDSDEDELPLRSADRRSFSSSASFHTAESPLQKISKVASVSIGKKSDVIDLISDDEDADDESTFIKSADTLPEPVKRELSSLPDFGGGSDYDVPSENEELREVKPSKWAVPLSTPTPKSDSRKKSTRVSSNKIVTQRHWRQSVAIGKDSDNESDFKFDDETEYEIPSDDEELLPVDPNDWPVTDPVSGSLEKGRKKGGRGNTNEAVLKHRNQSLATPWLYTLARPFYPNKVDVLEDYPHEKGPDSLPDLNTYLEEVRSFAWEQEDADRIRFNPWAKDDPKNRGTVNRHEYASVTIDGTSYFPGDCIMVRGDPAYQPKGRQKGKTKSVEENISENQGNPWHGRILFFHKDEFGSKSAHIQWFDHASATIQGELACAHELLLLSQCSDEDVGCIASKITVTPIDNSLVEKGGIVEEKFIRDKEYFCRFHYNPDTYTFTDASIYDFANDDHAESGPCEVCNKRTAADKEEGSIKILGPSQREGSKLHFQGFRVRDTNYYLYNFVYIFEDEKEVYKIGQIVDISARAQGYDPKKAMVKEQKLHIKVGIYQRFDDFQKPWFKAIVKGSVPRVRDERRLYYTGINCPTTVNELDGKCCVQHREEIENFDAYKDKDDHFWVDQQVSETIRPGDLVKRSDLVPLCSEDMRYSEHSTTEAEERLKDFTKKGKKLVALDLFSGAGGLTLGMEFSQIVETRHAVEFSEAACRTYKKNFPDCTMHNADINLMLERAVRRDHGEQLDPLHDCHGDLVEELPARGEIDFIYGGCPCPGYSGANRFPQDEDIKNSLLVVTLSYVDYYRPKYFLLENVKGLLTHRLGATQERKKKLEGGIEKGTVKFILRALTSLGYQVHFALLQAAEYGVPSSRKRVFFWASLPGYNLPKFPQQQNLYKSATNSADQVGHRKRRSAPHRACTVGDAITDLPKFDWSHPKVGDDRAITIDRKHRMNTGINQFVVYQDDNTVGLKEQSYATGPLSEYQRKMRLGVGMDGLQNHVTMHWSDAMTMLICEIPLRPGADHRDVSTELRSSWPFLWHPDSAAPRQKFYRGRCGRLDMEELFETCLTNMNPTGKNGRVVHPTQHRVLSVVEFARAMSFPDSFVFALEGSRVADIIRQIGNAVPPFLAKAVGAGLAESVLLKFEEDRKKTAAPNPPLPKQKGIKSDKSFVKASTTGRSTEGRSSRKVIYID
ncbi:hypothetical protein VTL71DRAFT_14666 [Oculimacula yallundae]|uniref:Cytosine-specific methyltransferase n=1 Tax=Oculimacula yallundae TaxID=86028 RepID=A0ABR4CJ42_9HELO